MIHFVKGNLLDSKCNLICHQVNCQGVMGSGVARQIREKWPEVYNQYCERVESSLTRGQDLLGQTQAVNINENQSVVNIFGQLYYNYDGRKYTSYDAFETALYTIKKTYSNKVSIAFPYKIASDRGGANWRVIRTMIEEILEDREVYIYYLNEENLLPEDKRKVENNG